MKFLRRRVGKTKRDRVHKDERICQELEIAPLKDILEARPLKWFGHVIRMDDHRDPLKTMDYVPDGRRLRISYLDYIERLCRARGKDIQQARNREEWNSWLNTPLS
ncbi:uncharacterized protein [Halyomorpha halys]|uniref:uncharacterized protein n=1 Tax=Halyomorpha halys TaxID=286706 RepID=UPI0034D3549F